MTYLPPDWCICFSDEYDCSGYNACSENLGKLKKKTNSNENLLRNEYIILETYCNFKNINVQKIYPISGYPVNLSSDGFEHIRSISILSSPVCKAYHMKKLPRPPTPNIKGLE